MISDIKIVLENYACMQVISYKFFPTEQKHGDNAEALSLVLN